MACGRVVWDMKRLTVLLSPEERAQLHKLIGAGIAPARSLTHARILLKADHGVEGPGWNDRKVAAALDVGVSTVGRVRERYASQGLEATLQRKPPARAYLRKLDGGAEAQLIALACGAPPAGQARWTLRLLADRMVTLEVVEDLSYETVRRTLKKPRLNRG